MIALLKSARSSFISHQILISCNRSHITTTVRQFYGLNHLRPGIQRVDIRNILSTQAYVLRKNVNLGLSKMYYSKGVQTNVASSGSKLKQIDRQYLKRLISLAKPERWKLAGGILFLLVSSAVTMSVPFAIGKLIDMINEQLKSSSEMDKEKLQKQLSQFCGVLLLVFALGGACNAGRVFLMNTAGQRISKSIREKVYQSMIRQETAFFDRHKTGELLSRLSSDTLTVSELLSVKFSDGVRSIISVSAGLTMMFYTSTKLSFLTLVGVVPPIAFLLVVVGKYIRILSKQVQGSLAAANQVAEERFSNIRVVKTFGHEKYECNLYSKKLEDLLQLVYKEAKVRALFFGLTGFSGNVVLVSALYVGAPMLGDSTVTVGQLSSFLIYAGYVSLSASGIANLWSDVNKGLGASAHLWDILDRKSDYTYNGGIIPESKPRGQVEFENVTFAYPSRSDVTVLNGLNLSIPAGAMTAVVGGSGSGKSTIASLLLRFYYPHSGQILFDGQSVKELDWTWLRKNVALVSQEPVLFSGSIRDNIAYGSVVCDEPSDASTDIFSRIPEEEIWKAAKIANADKFISMLPNGLDTIVGERGITLSGGQRQRIAIARALMRDPKVLLLDEATSALDAESEHLVQDALEKIMLGRTVLVIAHRLSTVRNADQIAVLENGGIAELGSYDELMAKENGAFKTLVRLQTFQTS
ncbi:ATP-binding cassette sub-family B member 10, mitochondrial-like isoform X2 [Thrips palmi]|uniref:ATP-binding cassette sub-family B member 10, mitochondrial-like isoform X2 n=1 Tax=Thrips palmi TaxID=161013 RepID=A0A6P8YSV6_THRPL|nr:ATP-binding cassette sub-family B member 10, mitochondrial-like isoform X2 [Thrips palmi]